jgi:mannosylglycerate hydrolase
MPDTKPLSAPPMATLHIIAHMRWDREWYETFETCQARLLDQLAWLLDKMGNNPDDGDTLRFFLLGGQTVIIDDIASVRPDMVPLLVIFNAGGRLGLGPWYTQVNQQLVSGESLVRNLLMARVDAAKHGMKLLPIAFMPDAGVHVAQLPQILRGFNMTTTFINAEDPYNNQTFYWRAPDKTNVLVVQHDAPPPAADNHDRLMNISVQAQRRLRPEGPFLWLLDFDSVLSSAVETLNDLQERTNIPTSQIDLSDYLRILRRGLTDTLHGDVKGELRPPSYRQTPPGTLSTRIYLKQLHHRVENKLLYAVEPWLTLALTHGDSKHMENASALLHQSWRQLLKNQSTVALGGTAIDAVHEANEVEYRRIDHSSDHVLKRALNALPGTPTQPGRNVNPNPTATTYVVVWNSHNWPLKQVVEVPLTLPEGYFPQKLRTPGSEDPQLFGWQPAAEGDSHTGIMTFLADAPAVGYTAYTVELGDAPVEDIHLHREGSGRSIVNVNQETLTAENGRLTWKRGDSTLDDLLNFYDGGDAGDAYHYCPPTEDAVMKADMVGAVRTVSTPVYERLVISHRMRVANALNDDRTRSRGVRLLELKTTATFYDHVPGLYLQTTVENSALDHRLRAHIRTGLDTASIYTMSPFHVERRGVGTVVAMQGGCAVHDGADSMALLARGLPEVESMHEDDQVTLALTLLRSVGWLSRDDLSVREGNLAPSIAVPDAQVQREVVADYALVSTPAGNRAALMRATQAYNAPLQAYQYDERPGRPRRSYVSVVSDQAAVEDAPPAMGQARF